MNKDSIESVIKKYRNYHGLSRRELADMLNVSTRLIETYEYGKVTPPLNRLKEIIRVLDIPVLEFFKDTVHTDGYLSKIEARLLKYKSAVEIIDANPELLDFIAYYGKHAGEFKDGKVLKLLEKIIKPASKLKNGRQGKDGLGNDGLGNDGLSKDGLGKDGLGNNGLKSGIKK